MNRLTYPGGKLVTTAYWSGSSETRPIALISYSTWVFLSPTNDDWTMMLNELLVKAGADAIFNIKMRDSALLFILPFHRLTISGEVATKTNQ